MNALIYTIRRFVRSCGYDVVHHNPISRLLKLHPVDLVLDVGANIGQTYDLFRQEGYTGRIVSFEPNPAVFQILSKKKGNNWEKYQLALSTADGEAEFFATRQSGCSGLHPHLKEPVLETFKVPRQRLDQFWKWDAKSAFLKIDTEGHDLEVVKGASGGVLDKVQFIMLEVVFEARYQGEPVFLEVVETLGKLGFKICKVENVYRDLPSTGTDKAVDLIFSRL